MLDQQTRTWLIQQFAAVWGAAAWKSYQIQGRGILSVRVRRHNGDNVALSIDYLSARECKNGAVQKLVARYHPAVEYVLLLGTDDNDAEGSIVCLEQPLADLAADAPSADGSGKQRHPTILAL